VPVTAGDDAQGHLRFPGFGPQQPAAPGDATASAGRS